MRGKDHSTPFLLLLLTVLLFGRKKPAQEEKPASPTEPFPIPEILKKTVTDIDATRARDHLRVASLERDIIGDAMTKIYEAEAKGKITEPERNRLVQKYKVDLKRVDGEIGNHRKVVDLHELESAKEDLLKSFHEKMLEIDARINKISPLYSPTPAEDRKTAEAETDVQAKEDPALNRTQTGPSAEKPVKEKPKNKAEERLEAIREEVLKAMERLEQIETEG